MASAINLRRRIKTGRNIAKLTHALEMVSASKMRRAKEKTEASRPYADKLSTITASLQKRVEKEKLHPFFEEKEKGKILLIAISPDRALCGPLITNLVREFHNSSSLFKQNIVVVTVGKKLAHAIARTGAPIVADFPFGATLPSFDMALQLRALVVDGFLSGEFMQVFCLYSKFENVFLQHPQVLKLLPIKMKEEAESKELLPYLFEPNTEELLDSLLPHSLEIQLYQILLEAYASEQGARMNAMHNATENAKEVVDILTLDYNKLRQEKVTNEILDIITATSAVGQ